MCCQCQRINDLGQQEQRWLRGEIVFLENRVKRALSAMVSKFNSGNIKRSCAQASRFIHHLIGRYEVEFRVRIDKLLDQPRAGHAVYLDVFARNPLHESPLFHRHVTQCSFNPLGHRSGSSDRPEVHKEKTRFLGQHVTM